MNTDTLLSYGMNSFPSPMQVNFNNACLNIAISPKNPENQVWCSKIVFTLPIGLNAQDLTNDAQSIAVSVSSGHWEVSSITSGGQVTMSPIHNTSQLIPNEGISIQFSQIYCNTANGTCELAITEHTALPGQYYSPKEKKLKLTKFPEGFWVGDFVSSKVNVRSGQSVTLSWKKSGAGNLKIIFPTPSGEQKSVAIEEGKTSWESGPLRQTTAFELQASTGSANDLQKFTLQTVVNVSDQELVLDTLTVNSNTQLNATTSASKIDVKNEVTAEKFIAITSMKTPNLFASESAYIQDLYFCNMKLMPKKESSVSILDKYYPIVDAKSTQTQSFEAATDLFLFVQGLTTEVTDETTTAHIKISGLPHNGDDVKFKMILTSKSRDATFACFPVPRKASFTFQQFNPTETQYFLAWTVSLGTN
ncbi:MAG: hypothetical protein MI784_07905 [Cytophagales bacterium]|nr:hypothetical protein [Cytophagales bacterium]